MIKKSFVTILVLTIIWLSGCEIEQPDDNDVHSPIKAGDEAPYFSLENATGGRTSLNDYRGKSNVVLVFHQGST